MSKHNYKLEIIDESENCDTALELFYENELYEYYFSCIKSDYVYARINDGEKYLVKELLINNPTDYIISIDKLKRAGLDFIKKEKYDKIELYYKGNVYISRGFIEDKNILEIGWGSSSQGIDEISQEVFLIPKAKGITNLSFDIYDSHSNELIDTIKYEISINDLMKITYQKLNQKN